jgi:hypothetical protein
LETAEAVLQEPSVAPHHGLEDFLRCMRGDEIARRYWVNLLAFAVMTAFVVIAATYIPFNS